MTMTTAPKKLPVQGEHVLLVLVIAAFTSALWRYILGVPPFEEFWWAHFAPVGAARPSWYELCIAAASCLTWGALAPFLRRNKLWSVLPAAVIAPFLWALLVNAGLLVAAGAEHFGWSGVLVELFRRGLFTFLMWALSAQAARVLFPVSLLAAALVWLALNKFDSERVLGRLAR